MSLLFFRGFFYELHVSIAVKHKDEYQSFPLLFKTVYHNAYNIPRKKRGVAIITYLPILF